MKLILENQLTHKIYELDNLTDNNTSRLFYEFTIVVPNMEEGIYHYTLLDNGTPVATGLFQCGNFTPEVKPYTGDTIKESNGYVTYQG